MLKHLQKLTMFVKSMWALIAGFIGVVTVIVNIAQLWQGNRDLVTYILLIVGYCLLLLALIHVSFVATTLPIVISSGRQARVPLYGGWSKIARAGLVVLITLTLSLGAILYGQDATLKDKVVIVVANIDGPDRERFRVTEQIILQLHQSLDAYNDTVVRSLDEYITEQDGLERALRLGRSHRADIVIWGWYGASTSDVLLVVHIENLSESEFLPIGAREIYQMRTNLHDFNRFRVQQQLSDEMSALTSLVSGIARYEAEDWDEAILRLSASLDQPAWAEDVGTRAATYYYRGISYFLVGDTRRAIDDFSTVIELVPGAVGAYNNRGVAYKTLGKLDEAIEDFTKAIEIDCLFAYTDSDAAYYNRGNTYALLGQYEEAVQDYTRAIEINSGYAEPFFNRAKTNEVLGNRQLAIDDYRMFLRLSQDPSLRKVAETRIRMLESKP